MTAAPTPPPGGSAIALTTKFFPLAFLFFFIKPRIFINGQQVPVTVWGRNVLPVAPGRYELFVYVPYFLPPQVGKATLIVDVMPGQQLELEYRVPMLVWVPGSLGTPPQKYNGMWFTWVLFGLVVLVIVCCCGSFAFNINY